MTQEQLSEMYERLKKTNDKVLTSLIYELINERENLVVLNKIDPLTNTYNRRILDEIDNYSAVVMCDIDDFKGINDTFGHDVGDKVIKNVANILKSSVRCCDYVCRFGGDEFCIIFQNCDVDCVKQRMGEIIDTISSKNIIPYAKVSISVGIAQKKDYQDIHDITSLADKALYVSKNSGKNTLTVYNDKILRK